MEYTGQSEPYTYDNLLNSGTGKADCMEATIGNCLYKLEISGNVIHQYTPPLIRTVEFAVYMYAQKYTF